MYVYVYICIYIHVYIYTYTCIYVYIYLHTLSHTMRWYSMNTRRDLIMCCCLDMTWCELAFGNAAARTGDCVPEAAPGSSSVRVP